jgi:protein TonB
VEDEEEVEETVIESTETDQEEIIEEVEVVEEEARRIIEKSPKMIPGKQRGRAV